jgi:hypothetical protein
LKKIQEKKKIRKAKAEAEKLARGIKTSGIGLIPAREPILAFLTTVSGWV